MDPELEPEKINDLPGLEEGTENHNSWQQQLEPAVEGRALPLGRLKVVSQRQIPDAQHQQVSTDELKQHSSSGYLQSSLSQSYVRDLGKKQTFILRKAPAQRSQQSIKEDEDVRTTTTLG